MRALPILPARSHALQQSTLMNISVIRPPDIETRSLPISLAATLRGFAFYVALPKSSIPSIATCSILLIPQLHSRFVAESLRVTTDH
jgi:hypothetical protein